MLGLKKGKEGVSGARLKVRCWGAKSFARGVAGVGGTI